MVQGADTPTTYIHDRQSSSKRWSFLLPQTEWLTWDHPCWSCLSLCNLPVWMYMPSWYALCMSRYVQRVRREAPRYAVTLRKTDLIVQFVGVGQGDIHAWKESLSPVFCKRACRSLDKNTAVPHTWFRQHRFEEKMQIDKIFATIDHLTVLDVVMKPTTSKCGYRYSSNDVKTWPNRYCDVVSKSDEE